MNDNFNENENENKELDELDNDDIPSDSSKQPEIQEIVDDDLEQKSAKTDDTTSDDATSDDATSDDATSNDATSDDTTSDDATSDDATSDDATSDDATSDDATSDDATSNDAKSKDTTSNGSFFTLVNDDDDCDEENTEKNQTEDWQGNNPNNPNNQYYPPNYPQNFYPNQQNFPPNANLNQHFNNPYMQRPPYIPPMDPRLSRQNMYQNQYNGFENEQFNSDGDLDADLEGVDKFVYSNSNNILVNVLSLLLLCSLGFSFYLYNSDNNNNNNAYFSSGNSPSMEISYTPDPIPNNDITGVLTNNEIHAKVSPSVVGIAVYTRGLGNVLQSEGSGIVMSEDGFVITNYHVIANDSSNPVVKIEIIMHDGETYDARVIGGDSKTDLAVVKIDAVELIPAEFGDSSKLKIGDRVAVIGNPSGIAFAGSFTQGCVSALSRSIYMSDLNAEIEYIQTDAAINSGNSGGAFINEYGQVVGISAAKMKVEAGYEGMGFAIPINNAKVVVDSLIEYGYVAGRPRVGIEYKAISPTLAELNSIPVGLRVYTVGDDVDAYEKIVPGDIITMFDGIEVYDSETVATALADKRAGEKLVVTVYRVDEETGVSEYLDVTVILSESVGEKLAETMY